MYIQLFPIYGFMVGINYWNSNMEELVSDQDETEHLFQLMVGIIGISFHIWR